MRFVSALLDGLAFAVGFFVVFPALTLIVQALIQALA